MTRRALAVSALAGAAAAQTPAPAPATAPATPDELAEAHKRTAATSQTLQRYESPMSAEPAFQFKP